MPQNVILSLDKANRNVDPTALSSSLELIQDGMIDVIDSRFVLTQKPGLSLFCDFGEPSGIDGLYWSDKLNKVIAVTNGNIKTINDANGAFADISGDKLTIGTKVTFTELFYGAIPLVFMANGTKIVYTDGVNPSLYHPDPNAPNIVTHVDNIDTYLVANLYGTQSWYYAGANSPLDFTTNGNSYDNELQGTDDLDALFVAKRRLYLFKKNAIDTWVTQPSGTDPFTRLGTTMYIDSGLFSPYAICLIDRQDGSGRVVAFMNQNRQVCILNNDSSMVISKPYNKIFQDIAYASDVVMDSISIGGKGLLLLTFRSAGKSIVYDYQNDVWYEWGYWNGDTSYNEYPAINYCYAKAWNLHLIGDRNTGKVYKLDRDVYSDNGNPIRTLVRTGHINHGNDAIIKKSLGLTIRAKRGVGIAGDADTEPMMRIRKNDNGKGNWSNWQDISMGKEGDTALRGEVFKPRGGTYFTRQYEIAFSDDAPFALSGIWENIQGVNG